MNSEVDDVLEHFGKKGMHWGIRNVSRGPSPVMVKAVPGKKILSKGGERQPAHDDAIQAVAAKQKAKLSTTDSLSNKELQTAVTRMNLEQQYTKLTAAAPTKATGKDFAKAFVTDLAKSEIKSLVKGNETSLSKIKKTLETPGDGKHRLNIGKAAASPVSQLKKVFDTPSGGKHRK